MSDQNGWMEVKGKIEVRKGARAPWLELRVTGLKDGAEVTKKLIAKTVDEFISERTSESIIFDK